MASRRKMLKVVLAGAAAAALPSGAMAFRVVDEDEASPRVQSLFGACETRNAHERLVAELLADLEGEQGAERAALTVRGLSCPFCGCGLAQALPEPGARPRF